LPDGHNTAPSVVPDDPNPTLRHELVPRHTEDEAQGASCLAQELVRVQFVLDQCACRQVGYTLVPLDPLQDTASTDLHVEVHESIIPRVGQVYTREFVLKDCKVYVKRK